mmetsp:Transcript_36089/g.44913  ORF Transcript_36089/g.44913 Transcript_36089/m.44913 type:complete len:220 (-) Transcript_36089:267-926(-)
MVEIDPIIRVALLRPCDSECYGLRTKSMFEALLEQGSNNMSENSSRIVVEEFDVINLKYPDENELGLYASFVIVGSLASAYDDHPWTEKLLDFIRRLHLENRRVLGVCFGHQIIARAMGGKVRKVPAGTQYGVRSTCLTDEGRKFFEDIEKESVSFIYTHGDEVIELPVGATSIGGNDIVPVHGMVFDGGNMVCLPCVHKMYTLHLVKIHISLLCHIFI